MLPMNVDWHTLNRRVSDGDLLSEQDAELLFGELLDGKVSDADTAEFLGALHRRGETLVELVAAVKAARARQLPCPVYEEGAIDTCGTGGDGVGTFNVSTAVALAAAASGVTVVKHGNRASTSKSGSADVLEALGVEVATTPAQVNEQIAEHRFAFVFAPAFHPGFKHVAAVRKTLPHRTIFNLLGPLLNPARVRRQVIGVFSPKWVTPIAEVVRVLGHERALVVNGGGTDELSGWGEQVIATVGGSAALSTTALAAFDAEHVAGGSALENAALIHKLLQGQAHEACTQLVAMNLAAAWWVAGRGVSVPALLPEAVRFLKSGEAGRYLESLSGSR